MGKKKKKNLKKPKVTAPEAKRVPEAQPVREPDVVPAPRGKSRVMLFTIVGLFLAVGLVAFLVFAKSFGPNHVAPGKYKNYNVLLITMDTTRADHLPAYGYTQVKTPNLDQLAAKSFIFEDAISHAPLTLPSHTSILTGLLPVSHGVRDNGGYFLDPKEITLAELLKKNGYATAAFISAFVLDSRWGLNQGFDFYFDHFNLAEFQDVNTRDIQRRGDETEGEAENWLQKNKSRRFFSWVHLYDPHDPYNPPEPYKTTYAGHLYDGEIAFTDDVIGKLFRKLKELGVNDRTIIIVTGDHGESLGQHHEATHAMFIYNSTQHVPLFIFIPGKKNERIRATVRHIDIAPTILALLGLEIPKTMQGASLIPLMNQTEKSKRPAFSESIYADIHYGWSPLQGLTTEEYKYIDAPKPELYDRIHDPQETKNLIGEKRSVAKVLQSELKEILAKSPHKYQKGPQKMDPETEEKLRALGYIGTTAVSTEESRKIDPKDKIQLAEGIQQAFGALMMKDNALGLRIILPVLQQDPGMIDGHFAAGVAYANLEQYPKAIDELMKVIALKPDHTGALYNLGYAYEMMGNQKEAEHWYLQVLKYREHHLFAAIKLAHLYRMMNEPEKARPYFLEAVKFYEKGLEMTTLTKSKSALYSTLGEIYFGAGQLDQAEKNLKAAIALTPDTPTLHYNLAQVYEAKQQFLAAVDEYKKEIDVAPLNFRAFNNLGILYAQLNQPNEALSCFQKVVDLRPQDQRGYLLLASTYQKLGKPEEANRIVKLLEQRQKESNKMR
jgi:arylsulfatase A-like enzyme/Flp pilus assembly protein TadD